jgi:hypothetical protein
MNYKCLAVFCFVCFGLCLALDVGSGWFLRQVIFYELVPTTCTVISAKFTNCSVPSLYRCVDLILEGWVCGTNQTVDQTTLYTLDQVPKYLPPVPSMAGCWSSPHLCELYGEPGINRKSAATTVFSVAVVLTLAFMACGVFFYRKPTASSTELNPLLASKETL